MSRLELEKGKENSKPEINDAFPDERLLCSIAVTNQHTLPWYSDIANYLASNVLPPDLEGRYPRKKFLSDAKNYFWDPPF